MGLATQNIHSKTVGNIRAGSDTPEVMRQQGKPDRSVHTLQHHRNRKVEKSLHFL
jgi:hypothetical protein